MKHSHYSVCLVLLRQQSLQGNSTPMIWKNRWIFKKFKKQEVGMIFNYNQGRFLIQTRKTWLNVELLDVYTLRDCVVQNQLFFFNGEGPLVFISQSGVTQNLYRENHGPFIYIYFFFFFDVVVEIEFQLERDRVYLRHCVSSLKCQRDATRRKKVSN